MTHSKQESIKKYFVIPLYILFGIFITYYVYMNFQIWGVNKGFIGSFFWIFLICAFLGILMLDTYKILLIYIAVFPFLLRLNVTTFNLQFGDVYFHPFMIAEILLIIVLTLKLLINKSRGNPIKKACLEDFIIWYALVMTFIGSIISALLSESLVNGDTSITMISSFGQMIIPGIMMILIYHSISSEKQVYMLIRVFYLAFILNIFIGSFTFLTNITGAQLFFKRMPFNFNGPNIYSSVIQLFIPLGIYFIFEAKQKKMKIIYYSFFFIIMSSLLMTLSRGGTIAAISGFFLLAAFNHDLRKPLKKVFIVMLLILMSLSTAMYNLFMRFQELLTSSRIMEFSTLIRTSAWKASLDGILRYPFGIGGNQFPLLWADMGRFPSQRVLHSHQFLLGIAVEYGLLSLFGFLIMSSIILRKLIRIIKGNFTKVSKRLSSTLLVSIIAYLIMGIISEGPRCHLRDTGDMFNDGLIFFYMFLAIAFKYANLVQENEKENLSNSSI